jgi:hypothetical protein
VNGDYLSHSPSRYRIDMNGVDGGPDYFIVAARTGTIGYIVDTNAEPTDFARSARRRRRHRWNHPG